jgi:hypothetical protein
MRLLRLSEVETRPSDRVYSHSRWRALLAVALTHGADAWLVLRAYTMDWKPGYFIAAMVLLFVNFLRRFIIARFRASNWLVRMNDSGIFVQFRSYLIYHLPADDLTVIFFSYGEIRSAGLIKERVTVPDASNRNTSSTQYLRYVELEFSGDTVPLAQALEAEATEKAPAEKRWYGNGSTLYQDHPVRLTSPPFLQIRWTVVPGTHNFLNALRPYTQIADTVSLKQDFTKLQSLTREEQQKELRELAARGETIAAIYTARKLYGCGLAEAKQIIEGLQRGAEA